MSDLSQLNVQCALAMGWYQNDKGQWVSPSGTAGRVIPSYVDDCNDVRELEDEIERRALVNEYLTALSAFLPKQKMYRPVCWDFMRATPEQRARAFLKAVEGTQ